MMTVLKQPKAIEAALADHPIEHQIGKCPELDVATTLTLPEDPAACLAALQLAQASDSTVGVQ